MNKSLFEKINQIIDEHINEIIDNKMKSERQYNKELIKKEIMLLSKETKYMYKDIFGSKCILSDMTKDHIMPINEGGSNIKANILWICRSSNKTKDKNIEGSINEIKFKVRKDINSKTKGTVGIISIYDSNSEKMQSVSAKKENNRFLKFKENFIEN